MKKFMTVSGKNIQTEGLGNFLKNLGKIAEAGRRLATNVLENPSRALDITAIIATAAASRYPKTILSTLPRNKIFYHKSRRDYLGKVA